MYSSVEPLQNSVRVAPKKDIAREIRIESQSKSKSESNDSCNSIGEIGVGFNPSGSFNIGIQSGIPCVNILNFNDISPKKNINNNANNYVNDLNNDDDDDV